MEKLKKTQEKLIEEEQLLVMGKLSGEVAHDIRNPLSSMNRLIYYLFDEKLIENNEKILIDLYEKVQNKQIDSALFEKSIKYLLANNIEIVNTLSEIREINSVLRKIANDFLEYSQTSKEIPVNKIFISEIINSKINFYKDKCLNKKIKLFVNIKAELPVILFDYQIERIFDNLMDNAIKAIQGCKKEIKTITVNLSLENNNNKFVVLTIEDTGTGIDPQELTLIFKPFYTKRKKPQGTGLGLAIVKKITENANGFVSAESEINVGTKFIIRIPSAS